MKYIGNNIFVRPSLFEPIQIGDVVAVFVKTHDWRLCKVTGIDVKYVERPVYTHETHITREAHKSKLPFDETKEFLLREEYLEFICQDIVSDEQIIGYESYGIVKITNYNL